jgi:hypothetical protein
MMSLKDLKGNNLALFQSPGGLRITSDILSPSLTVVNIRHENKRQVSPFLGRRREVF